MNIRVKQAAAVLVAFAMMLTLVGPVGATSDLQAQIDALLAQIATLQAQLSGSSGSSGVLCTFTRSLFVGVASGSDVQCLQQYLNGAGFAVAASGAGSPGNETTFFGSLTQSATAAWQAANGVAPAVGYFGPISTAKYNSLVASGSTGSTGSTGSSAGLSGGAGAINDVDYVSGLTNEQVGEDQNNVDVAGLDIEADEGSDIELTALNLNFSQGTANRDFDKYADEVSVWFDGNKIAEIDSDDFTDDNNFDRTVSLDSGAIIRAGDTERLIVAISGVSNLDSNDESETWTLEFESVRFRDAQNAVISDSTTGDINDGTGRTFSFENFATAADLELKFAVGPDEINEQRVIDVDLTDDTDGVVFFEFTIEVEGDSDVILDDFPMTFTAVGSDVDHIINNAELWIDGAEADTLNIPATATTSSQLTFDDFDHVLKAGDKVDAQVRVDINDLDANFQEGDTLLIAIGENETDHGLFDADDEDGNNLVDADKTGSATTEAHTFFDNGFNIELVSSKATLVVGDAQASENDRAEFVIVYDVSAFGSDIYLGTSTEDDNGASAEDGVNYGVLVGGTADTDATTTAIIKMSNSDTDAGTGAFKIEEDTTDRFTLTVNSTASSDNFFEIQMNGLGWSADTDATADANIFTFDLEDFDAGPTFMNAR